MDVFDPAEVSDGRLRDGTGDEQPCSQLQIDGQELSGRWDFIV
jgi:hypothetical protein